MFKSKFSPEIEYKITDICIAYNIQIPTFEKPKIQLTLNLPPILSEIQRKQITIMSSCNLPKICLAGNSYIHRTDWTIGRLGVIHHTDEYTQLSEPINAK